MKKSITNSFAKLIAKIIAIAVVLFLFNSTKAVAGASDLYPSSFTGPITGGGYYCQNSAVNLSLSWGITDCSSGAFSYHYDLITTQWFEATSLSNSGGSLVSNSSGDASYFSNQTATYTPSTANVGVSYYYVTVSWNGYNCPSGSMTTPTTYMDSVIVMGGIVSYPGSPFCNGSATVQSPTVVGYTDGTYVYTGGTYTSAPSGLSIDPGTGSITPNLSSAGTYTVYYTIPANDGCNSQVDSTTVIVASPNDISNFGITADSVCQGFGSTVTVNSTTLASGPYTIYYDLSGTNTAAGNSASLTMSSNTGSFTTSVLNNSGYTTITIDSINNGGCSSVLIGVNALVDVYAPPSAPAVQVANILCNGGNQASATANVTGGQPPYTYLWSDASSQTTDTATGLTAGTYTVTVTDNYGCVGVQATVTITQPDPLVPSATVNTNNTCPLDNNGSATASAIGGTSPYTYSWSNSQTNATISGLTSGTYSVSVMDINGCSATASATITSSDALAFGGATAFSFVSSADQSWIVPAAVTQITLTTTGGSGGSVSPGYIPYYHTGGNGATITGVVNVTPGHTLYMIIGGSGYSGIGGYGGSGGGGTYVWDSNTNALLQVAGGGGGAAALISGYFNGENGGDGQSDIATLNTPTTDPNNVSAAGGSGGNGGGAFTSGDQYASSGGAGWLSNGTGATSIYGGTVTGGSDPANGGAGGIYTGGGTYNYSSPGGFGGGGACQVQGGGGGGYNGGGAGGDYTGSAGGGGGSYCAGTVTATSATNVGNGSVTISLSLTTVVKNIDCTPGTISIPPANGGVAPYTYVWAPSGGSTNVGSFTSAGTYTLTVTDANGCSIIDSAIVTGTYTNLQANITVTSNETCNGDNAGSVLSSPTGGTSPYTYSWSDANTTTTASVSNLSAGTYTLTLTDSTGCSATATATITQPAAIIATTTALTNVTCASDNNGSDSVSAIGGAPPYTYLWSNSQTNATVTGLTAGTYSVSVMDINGCSGTSSATITQSDFIAFAASATFSYVSSADQSWVVPAGVTQITVEATGGAGGAAVFNNYGNFYGGNGATVNGVVNVTPGHTIYMLVGGAGYEGSYGGGGGGGTYVWDSNTASLLVVAGGGGGASSDDYLGAPAENGGNGQSDITNLNTPTRDPDNLCAAGGTGGNGGSFPSDYYAASGGAGWNSNSPNASSLYGGTVIGGADPFNGGAGGYGGQYPGVGGFGGGGGADVGGGGGAGYNGGGGGGYNVTGSGGGGGSYCSGTVTSASAANTGNGVVTILYMGVPVVTNATCTAGGSLTIIPASGGTAPYTYNWTPSGGNSNTATGLSAGSYTITASDANGCSITASATVNGTSPPTVTTTVTGNVSCYNGSNGSAIANPSGGVSPYTYSWSDANTTTTISISNLSAGSYTVTVTDSNGCTGSATANITQPVRFIYISAGTISEVTCNGGNNGHVSVTPVGGTTPYTYAWSNGTSTVATTQSPNTMSAGTYTITVTDSCGVSKTATANVTQPNDLRDSIVSQTNITCGGGNGGSVTIGTKGGTYPYHYLWSNGGTLATLSGLTAGTYSVVISDQHGCSSSLTGITITQPAPFRDSVVSITYPLCNGGKGDASVGIKGGTPPYIYTWTSAVSTTNTAINISAGSYTVTVKDAHRCAVQLALSVTQPLAIRDTIVKSLTQNVSCFGNGTGNGSATVGVKYGTPPYTYHWNPNVSSTATATGLAAGIYSVSVTDNNGCSSPTTTVTITQPSSPLVDSVSVLLDVGCNGGNGGEVSIGTRGGTSPYTYAWSNGKTGYSVSGLTAGTYSVTITDNHGCNSIITGITVTQPLSALTSTIPTPTCVGSRTGTVTISASGGTSAYHFAWSNGRTTTTMTVPDGTYTVKVSDAHGCNATNSVIIACPGALKGDEGGDGQDKNPSCCGTIDNFNLYPNPNTGQFTLTGLEQGMTVEIYDYTGRKISTISAGDISIQLNISAEPNGIYLIRIMDRDGLLVGQKKVVKTN